MRAPGAGPPHLGGHYAIGVEGLHLQLAALVQIESLRRPGFVGDDLVTDFATGRTGGIVASAPSPSD